MIRENQHMQYIRANKTTVRGTFRQKLCKCLKAPVALESLPYADIANDHLGVVRVKGGGFIENLLSGKIYFQLHSIKRQLGESAVIIEGEIPTTTCISTNEIRRALLRINYRWNTPVYNTSSNHESAALIAELMRGKRPALAE